MTGVDYSGRMLELARRTLHAANNVTLISGDARELQRLVGEVDAVSCMNSLHYFKNEDKTAVARQVRSRLRPGARFGFNTGFFKEAKPPGTEFFYMGLATGVYEGLQREGFTGREHLAGLRRRDPSIAEYKSIIEDGGFRVVKAATITQDISRESARTFFRTPDVAESMLPSVPQDKALRILGDAIDKRLDTIPEGTPLQRNWLYVIAEAV